MKFLGTILCILLTSEMTAQSPNWILFDHNNSPILNDSITWVEVDTNNVKWIGTRNGLYSFDNNIWTVYNTSNSNIPNNRIDKFKIAYDNTIWLLNNNNGFIKFKNNSFTLYNKANLPTISTDSLVGLTIDSNEVFFWSNYNGISKFNSITNGVYNIDTLNSCLKNIETLVYHHNHTLYGLCKNPMTNPAGFPQNKADSILYVNDFIISNTPTISINYCFNNQFVPCNYKSVLIDKFYNRYELYVTSTTFLPPQFIRTFDVNNNMVSNQLYNQIPDYQILNSTYGKYQLKNNSADIFYATIFSPPSSNAYFTGNSIIPSLKIINFDSDKYNNIWLATPMGLVGYNDLGVITTIEKQLLNNYMFYPNPAQNELTIHFEKYDNVKTNFEFFDIFGRVISANILNININNEMKVDVSNLPNGIYYLKGSVGQKNEKYKKLLIRK